MSKPRYNVRALRSLSDSLVNEFGMPAVGISIKRWGFYKGAPGAVSYMWRGTVGEFLSLPEHQSGSWYIDGGWGGPPGPIRVDWIEAERYWKCRGFPPWDDHKCPHCDGTGRRNPHE